MLGKSQSAFGADLHLGRSNNQPGILDVSGSPPTATQKAFLDSKENKRAEMIQNQFQNQREFIPNTGHYLEMVSPNKRNFSGFTPIAPSQSGTPSYLSPMTPIPRPLENQISKHQRSSSSQKYEEFGQQSLKKSQRPIPNDSRPGNRTNSSEHQRRHEVNSSKSSIRKQIVSLQNEIFESIKNLESIREAIVSNPTRNARQRAKMLSDSNQIQANEQEKSKTPHQRQPSANITKPYLKTEQQAPSFFADIPAGRAPDQYSSPVNPLVKASGPNPSARPVFEATQDQNLRKTGFEGNKNAFEKSLEKLGQNSVEIGGSISVKGKASPKSQISESPMKRSGSRDNYEGAKFTKRKQENEETLQINGRDNYQGAGQNNQIQRPLTASNQPPSNYSTSPPGSGGAERPYLQQQQQQYPNTYTGSAEKPPKHAYAVKYDDQSNSQYSRARNLGSPQKTPGLEETKQREGSLGKPKYEYSSGMSSSSGNNQPLSSMHSGFQSPLGTGGSPQALGLGSTSGTTGAIGISSQFQSKRENSFGLAGSPPKYRDLDLAPHVQPAAGNVLSLYVTQVPDVKSMGAKNDQRGLEETNGAGSVLQRRPQTASAGSLGGLRTGMNSPKSTQGRIFSRNGSRIPVPGERERVSFYFLLFNFSKLRISNRDQFEAGLSEHRDLFQQIFQGLHYMRGIRDTPVSMLEQKRVFLERHPKNISTQTIPHSLRAKRETNDFSH